MNGKREKPIKRALYSPSLLCNNDCIVCGIYSEKQEEFIQPDFEKIASDIKKMRENGITHFWISGGEPTINKDILRILRLTKSLGFSEVIIFTNGRALSDAKFLDVMIKSGADRFHIALQSHNPQIHDYLTRRSGSFNETIQGIENVVKEKSRLKRVTVAHVMNIENIGFLTDFAQLIVSLKIDCQIAYPFFSSPSQYEFLPRYSDLKESLHEAIKILLRGGLKISVETVPPCFLIGFERYYADYHRKQHKMILEGYRSICGEAVKEEYIQLIGSTFKTHPQKCKLCFYQPACSGVFSQYIETFGEDEFEPVIRK